MGEFAYKARDARGQVKTGKVTAVSEPAAKAKLTAMRFKAITVTAVAAGGNAGNGIGSPEDGGSLIDRFIVRKPDGKVEVSLGSGMPSTKDLAVFTKQFSLMIERGVPLIQALNILGEQQKSYRFSQVIAKIRFTVENGSTLSDAMSNFPRVFDSLYIAMMRAGEMSGSLDVILRQLVTYIEKAAKLKSQLKSAMVYPMIILTVAVGVVTLLLVFVVPTFAKQYTDSGNEMPGLTAFVINLSNFMVNYYYMMIAAVIAAFFAFRAWVKTESGQRRFDQLLLKSPVVGDVIQKVAVGRFCSTMSTMLLSGVSILEALNICAASAGNKIIEEFVYKVRERISSGATFSEPLGESTLFPKMVTSMVYVGESTGALDQTLAKIAEIYEEEVDLAVTTMKSMVEPIMIVFIGGVVGFIVIAMYLPIFDMAKNVAGG